MKKYRISILTTTRAEYGLLRPLLFELKKDPVLQVELLVSGSHLSSQQGLTIQEIKNDQFSIALEVPLDLDHPNHFVESENIANSMKVYNDFFHNSPPHRLIVIGDRYEIIAPVLSAFMTRVPIIHLYGGELTCGAIDDCIRHSVTKFASLHVTSCEEYRNRVIQLGENPSRVLNAGALFVDAFQRIPHFSKSELEKDLNFTIDENTFLFTYHPETSLTPGEIHNQLEVIASFLEQSHFRYIITGANSDASGELFNKAFESLAKKFPERISFIQSLGNQRYYSLIPFVAGVVGNSSSGIIEVPYFKTPTVNIGNRQQGRKRTASVIDCECSFEAINAAIKECLCPEFLANVEQTPYPFGEGNSATLIHEMITTTLDKNLIQKEFYDLPQI